MSEPIPESVPTLQQGRRPVKKQKVTAVSQQAKTVEALFAKPDKEIIIPASFDNAAYVPPPPEIVSNVQGSSAGAGSGEFHVYKASRRREYERLRAMDEEVEKEKDDAAYEREREERLRKDQEATEKKRRKREKLKMKKNGKGGAQGSTQNTGGEVKAGKMMPRNDNVDADTAAGSTNGSGEVVEEVKQEGLIICDDD